MYNLLLIDDNREIQRANRDYLTEKGYRVELAHTGMEAISKLQGGAYDCILLDVMLPDLDGYAICAAARKTISAPIIFLSCKDGEEDRVKGLLSGGDDFMVKPYSLAELGARVFAQIRRSRMHSGGDEEPCTNIMIDSNQHTVTINGTNIILSKREFEILSLLMKREGEPITTGEIYDRLWQAEADADHTVVRVYIQRIREKLGPGQDAGRIGNDYGRGYCYHPPAEARV